MGTFQNIIKEENRRTLDRPSTGVINKDRIWEQWYTEDAMKSEFPKMSQKDYLFSCIGDEPDRVIINNRGKKTLFLYYKRFSFSVSGSFNWRQ